VKVSWKMKYASHCFCPSNNFPAHYCVQSEA
jgi:hypothetical protein